MEDQSECIQSLRQLVKENNETIITLRREGIDIDLFRKSKLYRLLLWIVRHEYKLRILRRKFLYWMLAR